MDAGIKVEPLDASTEATNDEVVREIDIFLSPGLAPQLYLMQFPLQHQSLSLPLPVSARIKPRHGMIQIDQELPHNVELGGAYAMSHRTYSSQTIAVTTHMALGKIQETPGGGSALHLIPFTKVSQMRPSYSHIDEEDEARGSTEDDERKMKEEAKKNEKKPLLLQKKESERAALARKSSYAYKKASEDAEEWQELVVHGPSSKECEVTMDAVNCPSPETKLLIGSDETNDSSEYVRSLNYLPSSDDSNVDFSRLNAGDLNGLCSKLISLLHRGWPIPYSLLQVHFAENIPEKEIMATLSSCAVMVRGNFVLKSSLLRVSPHLAQARDFILYLLQSIVYIERKRLDHVYKEDPFITPEAILMLLEQLAEKSANGWRLKLDDDVEFIQRFPEKAYDYLHYWEHQANRYSHLVEQYKSAILD